MKLIIVDDNKIFIENLRFFLESKLGYEVIAEAFSGEEFLQLPNKTEADIILMDIYMEEMDGFETTRRLLWNFPYIKVIALTLEAENIFLLHLVEAGFRGFVDKNSIFDQLEKVIKDVNNGKFRFPKSLATKK